MQKYVFIIVIFVLSIIFDTLGALFKITHLEFGFITGNFLLFVGMIFKVFAALLFIIKLLSNNKGSIQK
jgi:uncharacterized membrane protein